MIIKKLKKITFLVFWACVMHAPALFAAPVDELKAAYILNFAKLTSWPADLFKSSTDPLIFCGLPSDPVMDALRALGEKNIDGRPVSVKILRDLRESEECHVLFIGERAGESRKAMKNFRKRGLLLIGDSEGFIEAGGTINYFIQDGKLRFEINAENARASDVVLSARLLNLARTREKQQ